jgi:VanZ family protein
VLWGLVVAQMLLIFAASASSDPGLPTDVSDKTAHFAAYAVLSALIFNALANGTLGGMTWTRAALAAALSVLYGLTDEWHQRFVPDRSPDPLDVVADAAGAVAAVLVLLAVRWVYVGWMRGRTAR